MKKLLIYTLVLSISLLNSSCFKEDEKLATKQAPAGDIIFKIPDAALPSSAGQPQLTQPDVNVVTGRFAITDDLSLTIGASSGLTNLSIAAVNTNTGASTNKATFSGVSGSTDWTYPVNTLDVGDKAPATGSTVSLFVTAANSDNTKTATRVFSVNVLDPFTITTPPATAFPDSTIVLTYTVPAATTLANATQVDIYSKRGKKGTETKYKSKTYSKTSLTDTMRFKMPPEKPGQGLDITKLDTVFFRYVATFATGRTVTKTGSTRFANVPLSKTTTALSLYNPAVTGTNASKTAYDFSKAAYNKTADGDALKDLKLTVSGSNIGFTAGAGNGTQFVKSDNTLYTSSTLLSYQGIRDAFAAGVIVTPPVTNVYAGDVYIAKIDGVGVKLESSLYIIFKVTAVNLAPPPNTGNTDNIVFDCKSK
jgi:hypothetical protein